MLFPALAVNASSKTSSTWSTSTNFELGLDRGGRSRRAASSGRITRLSPARCAASTFSTLRHPATGQRDLTGHADVVVDRGAADSETIVGGHRHAGGRAVLRHGAGGTWTCTSLAVTAASPRSAAWSGPTTALPAPTPDRRSSPIQPRRIGGRLDEEDVATAVYASPSPCRTGRAPAGVGGSGACEPLADALLVDPELLLAARSRRKAALRSVSSHTTDPPVEGRDRRPRVLRDHEPQRLSGIARRLFFSPCASTASG